MADIEFLFDLQLITALQELIKNAKHKLVLISPFIDLDDRIKSALQTKLEEKNFELTVLFGKNQHKYLKSIKKESLAFLMSFPNIEIKYNERLHAKFYLNDFEFILTSMNLYDYSLAHNIEVGIKCEFGATGLLTRAISVPFDSLAVGVNKISHDVLGFKNAVDPIKMFEEILSQSLTLYKTSPVLSDADGFKGAVGMKKLIGKNILENKIETFLEEQIKDSDKKKVDKVIKQPEIQSVPIIPDPNKSLSANQISKLTGKTITDVNSEMEQKGFISGNTITELGKQKGLVMKKYMGNDYISYPSDLIK